MVCEKTVLLLNVMPFELMVVKLLAEEGEMWPIVLYGKMG